MAESAALLADEVLPRKPLRQWVLSLPFALRFLLETDTEALTQVLGIVYRTLSALILKNAPLTLAAPWDSADPAHEQHHDMVRWIGGVFDPKGFDLNRLNRDFRARKRRGKRL